MWLSKLAEWKREGMACALLTVVEAVGSTPRAAGSKMAVNDRGETAGSIGGGPVEHISLEEARRAIKDQKCRMLNFALNGDEWQATADRKMQALCGGSMAVFIEPILPRNEVVIFGAGHIGEKLGGFCALLDIPYRVYDNRREFLGAERFPGARELIHAEYGALTERAGVSAMSYCVILTHGHAHDEECLEQLLKIKDVPYIGMIGSAEKVKVLIDNIVSRGGRVDGRLYSPVGLGLGRNLPGEIALSIIAEIVLLMGGGSRDHLRINWHEMKR